MSPRRIAYFVGAGLSKALEKPGKRIPLMYDFVSVMAEYADADRDGILLTTLVQLENAKVFEHGCSEGAQLAPDVAAGNASFEIKQAFKKAMMGRSGPPSRRSRVHLASGG